MDAELERIVREVMGGEQFGVLATSAERRLHTATILFAETGGWEMVFAIRPQTLKARHSYIAPDVTFQVDNRAVTATDRTAFTRISFEGVLRLVPRDHPDWRRYHDSFAAKLPFGATLLANPAVEIHVLTPWLMRVAVGAEPAQDVPLALPAGSR